MVPPSGNPTGPGGDDAVRGGREPEPTGPVGAPGLLEMHEVAIPLPPDLFYAVGRSSEREGVARGGVYDDALAAVEVYDRPWPGPGDRGDARLLGIILVSAGATLDDLLSHLEHLIGLDAAGAGR
jgi:hypothetical protein